MRFFFALLFCLSNLSFASPEPVHQRIIIDGNSYAFGSSLSNTYYYLKVPSKIENSLKSSLDVQNSNSSHIRLFPTGCNSSGNPTWELKNDKFFLRELSFCRNSNDTGELKNASVYSLPLFAEWISGNFIVQENLISTRCSDAENQARIKASFYSFRVEKGHVIEEQKIDRIFYVSSALPMEYKCQ